MVQQPAHSIIAELEDAVRGGSSARRVETLRQVTDLFLNDGERLSDDQVKVFDDVLCLLIARVETRAKAELSKRLAPLDYAPFEVIQHLAWDDEIEVAGSVLANSSRLGTEVLVEIASSKGQDHLLAISGRRQPSRRRHRRHRRSRRRQGDPQAGQQCRRAVLRAKAFPPSSPAPARTTNWSRSSAFAPIFPPKFLADLLRRAKDAVRAAFWRSRRPRSRKRSGRC